MSVFACTPSLTKWGVPAIFMLGLSLGGCEKLSGKNGSRAAARGESKPAPVVVARAERKNMPLQIEAIGWAESYQSVQVKSRVDGHLTEIHITEGQNVKAGDLLFTIDPRPFQAAVHLAEANLARDRALPEDARRDFEWLDGLFKEQSATEREHGRAKAKLDAALATVRADEAALEQARLDLEYCTIRSPIDGRAGDLLVDRGNMIKANETTLVHIEQISPIYVSFSTAEQHLSTIKQYMREGELRVRVVIPGDSGGPEMGMLTFLDSKVDTTTGQIRLKGTFQNENRRLWPGQYVNVTLLLAMRRDQVVIPSHALQTGQKGTFVFVLKEGNVVEVRPVIPGETVEHQTIIESGLEAGEVVVTEGQLRLVDGARVEIKAADSRPAQPEDTPVAHKGGRQ
ncbi:MAG TPA: efflux RND transporter periplasmic adaptor subunit [Phycisphaerae bacterium]|nr:efflux RND transporter periplasmic adaptor subunit [Phycisphaerae bacterium]